MYEKQVTFKCHQKFIDRNCADRIFADTAKTIGQGYTLGIGTRNLHGI